MEMFARASRTSPNRSILSSDLNINLSQVEREFRLMAPLADCFGDGLSEKALIQSIEFCATTNKIPECRAEPRSITVREAARLQGFPDDFRIYGAFSNQMEQVTNAVPPPLARAVLSVLVDVVKLD